MNKTLCESVNHNHWKTLKMRFGSTGKIAFEYVEILDKLSKGFSIYPTFEENCLNKQNHSREYA